MAHSYKLLVSQVTRMHVPAFPNVLKLSEIVNIVKLGCKSMEKVFQSNIDIIFLTQVLFGHRRGDELRPADNSTYKETSNVKMKIMK